jgi:hypothetical protein
MSEILPQSPEPCPCLNCNDRRFNEETKRTCHCDCEKYEKWSKNNRLRHEENRKKAMVERGLRDYELKRNNQIKKRCGF